MPSRRVIFHWFRIAAVTTLAILLLLFAATKIEMIIFRHRAEQLMADMHQIRLYQSTWTDAQKLMTRWGAWGRYEGSCTSASCKYKIELNDEQNPLIRLGHSESISWFFGYTQAWLLCVLGDHVSTMDASFRVHDGRIVRTDASQILYVEPWLPWELDRSYALIIQTKASPRLRRTKEDHWISGKPDQLAEHPNYVEGRPSGCTSCQKVTVTYSTHSSPAEIERLTTFNFSCFTRLLPCSQIEDALPAAKGWLLYHDNEREAIQQQHRFDPAIGCDIPLWAMARDQANVYVVDATSVTQKEDDDGHKYELASVRTIEVLKGKPPFASNQTFNVTPFAIDPTSLYPEKPEYLIPGRRYILLPDEDENDRPVRTGREPTAFSLPRCGVREDTPENRRELKKGFALKDAFAYVEQY